MAPPTPIVFNVECLLLHVLFLLVAIENARRPLGGEGEGSRPGISPFFSFQFCPPVVKGRTY